MTEEKKEKKKFYLVLALCILLVLTFILVTSYSYWKVEKKSPVARKASACLKINYRGLSNDINIQDAYPTSDEDGALLDGYDFSIENTCPEAVDYQIVLESIPTTLQSYMDYSNIKVKLDNELIYRYSELVDEEKDSEATYDIRDTKHLKNDVVAGNSTNNHKLRIWLASDAGLEVRGQEFNGRVKIFAGQVNQKEQTKYPADRCFTTYAIASSNGGLSKFDYENCYTNELIIPPVINGKNIIRISGMSFYDNDSTVQFYRNLGKLDISNMNYLKNIDNRAFFYYVGDGQELIIPSNVETIDGAAFYYYKGKKLVLGDSLKTIRSSAFYSYEEKEEKLIIPDGVTTIGTMAFMGYNGDFLKLGNSIQTIESHAFLAYRGVDHNNVKQELIIPDSVTTIGSEAFGYFRGSRLILGSGLTTIGDHAFERYPGAYNQTLVIPDSVTEIGVEAFVAYNSKKIKLGSSLGIIKNGAFTRYSGVDQELEIPDSVQTIGDRAFMNFQGNSLKLGNGVKYIGERAFKELKTPNLTINIPSTIETIGDNAFYSAISSITIIVDKPNLSGLQLGDNWSGNAVVKCKSNGTVIDCPN